MSIVDMNFQLAKSLFLWHSFCETACVNDQDFKGVSTPSLELFTMQVNAVRAGNFLITSCTLF